MVDAWVYAVGNVCSSVAIVLVNKMVRSASLLGCSGPLPRRGSRLLDACRLPWTRSRQTLACCSRVQGA